MKMDGATAVFTIFGFLLLAVGLGALLGIPVKYLWNTCLVPATSGLHPITWLRAWGLMILASILFKPVSVKNS